METKQRAKASPHPSRPSHLISPVFCLGFGAILIGAGILFQSLETGRTFALNSSTSEANASAAERLAARAAAKEAAARKLEAERRAKAAAELEQQQIEKAAEEKARRALLVDGATEAKARAEREEMARKRAAVEEAHNAEAQAESAWKQFYKPSANCRDASASATVECVNEYIKAKREFQARPATQVSTSR
jgi:hypothetical protein